MTERQKLEALNDSEEEKRNQAMQLAGLFDLDGMDEMMAAEMGVNGAESKKMAYYCQITVTDQAEKGKDGKEKEYCRIVAESEDDSLVPQSAFLIPAEEKQVLIPESCNGHANVSAQLSLGPGMSFEVKGRSSCRRGGRSSGCSLASIRTVFASSCTSSRRRMRAASMSSTHA